MLREPRFADQPPAQVYAKLLDEGRYLCSIRTMHRLDKVVVSTLLPGFPEVWLCSLLPLVA